MCNCSSNSNCNITALTKGEKGDKGDSYGNVFKVFTAIVNQNATDAPVLTVLENTLGVSLISAYDSVGTYILAHPTSGFTAGKTIVYGSNTYVEASLGGTVFPVGLLATVGGVDKVSLEVISSNTNLKVDGSLTGFIEIRVYL